MPVALGIESSCDDCSVSLVQDNGELIFLSQKNQNEIHKKYGGIVPELASRHHEESLLLLIDQALKIIPPSGIDLIAVSNRPGLLGSLLVGCVTAKTLSLAWDKPLVGVNHIEAHVFSPLLFEKPEPPPQITYPALALVVSGGHSSLFYVKGVGDSILLGETRDDSAGEAFDKMARLLGFEWPGGPQIDKLAQGVSVKEPFFSKINTDDLSFSFSGIKSQGQRLLSEAKPDWIQKNKSFICADYQEKIVTHLIDKLDIAFKHHPVSQILLGGGVSANSLLRQSLKQWSEKRGLSCLIPKQKFCMDNGAMIAFTGLKYFLNQQTDDLSMACVPRHLEKDFFKRESL